MTAARITTKTAGFSALCLMWSAITLVQNGCLTKPDEDPPPPGGGQALVLDYTVFATHIDSMLTAHGCDIVLCHGGGIRGTYQLSPSNDKDIDLDFTQSTLQANGADPASSPLLLKPLAETAGGDAHAGGDAFATTDDPCYQAILAWIEAGEFQ